MKQEDLKAGKNSSQAFHLSSCYRRPKDTQNCSWLTCGLVLYSFVHRDKQPKLCPLLHRLLPFLESSPKGIVTGLRFQVEKPRQTEKIWGHQAGPKHRHQQKAGFWAKSSPSQDIATPSTPMLEVTSPHHRPQDRELLAPQTAEYLHMDLLVIQLMLSAFFFNLVFLAMNCRS